MTTQKAISVKVYEDILTQFDAQLGAYEKRNQAINKAMKIYVELKMWREKIDQECESISAKTCMQSDFFLHALGISKSWRVG